MQLETVTVYLAKTGNEVRINRADYESWKKAGKSPDGKFVDTYKTPKPMEVEPAKLKPAGKRKGFAE